MIKWGTCIVHIPEVQQTRVVCGTEVDRAGTSGAVIKKNRVILNTNFFFEGPPIGQVLAAVEQNKTH